MARAWRLLAATTAAAVLLPAAVGAVTLDDAIQLALKHDPELRRAGAETDAARARIGEARSSELPSVALYGSVAESRTNFGPFFGFGEHTLTPSTAGVEVRQTLFDGGAGAAGVNQAKAAEAGARASYHGSQLDLVVRVAQAFEDVRLAEQDQVLAQHEVSDLSLVENQTERLFADGKAPRTDVDQAQARLAAAKGDLAQAQGDLAVADARYVGVVGDAPAGLEAPTPPAPAATDVNDAVAKAEASNPALLAARHALDAADAGVRHAEAEGLPTLALVANASSIRDEFLPGYRADGVSIGVEGRWALYSGGLSTSKVSEASAQRRAAEAAFDEARVETDQAAIAAWHGVATARAVSVAAQAEAAAADAALADVREEVRVGEKPTLDFLNAERDDIAARLGALRAEAAEVIAAYRLKAVLGS
jgi:TolC family type I secretion outer membrane protein